MLRELLEVVANTTAPTAADQALPLNYWVWDWHLFVGSLIFIVGGSMSASVGIGGGGIYVPVLVLICNFLPKEAIPLSKIAIFGVAVSSWLVNLPKRHPKADRPLIDYGVASIMMPTTALGTIVGITLYVIFPQWLILVLLVLVLGITVYRTFVKGRELWRKETAALEAAKQVNGENAPLIDASSSLNGSPQADEDGAMSLLRVKLSRVPIYKIMYMVAVWLCMFLLIYIRGGGEGAAGQSPVGILKCTSGFWLLGAGIAVFLILASSASCYVHFRTQKQLAIYQELKVDGDINWTIPKYAGFMGIGCFAGVCAGFLGIGAGMINVPFMLEMGLRPDIAAATSSFMIIFTAMSTVSQYILIGALPYYLGLWYAGVGLVAAVIGQFAVSAIVAKYKKSSIISFILTAVIAVSMVGLTVLGIIRIVNLAKSGGSFGFEGYC